MVVQKILIILALNMWFYARTIRYKYVSDDIPTFRNLSPKDISKHWKAYRQLLGRSKYNVKLDHITTMAIHALVCVGIYLGFGRNEASFIAALMFTFNPVTNQASIWTGGRGYALPALALVWSLTLPILSPLLLLGGCYYTAGFPTPLVFLFSEYWWFVLFAPVIWYIYRDKFKKAVLVKFKTESFGEDRKIYYKKFILAVKTYGYYLMLAIIPFKITFYHSFLQSCAGNEIMKKKAYAIDKVFVMGVVGILGSFYALLKGYHMVTFGLWWYAISIAPYCNFKRINQEIAERFAYIPTIGVMVALASVIQPYPLVTVAFIALYASRMWYIMPMYTDDYWICEYSCLESPDAWFSWHMRAMKRWDQQSFREALNMWTMCKMISPQEFKILLNIATCLFLLDKKKEGHAFLDEAEKHIITGQPGAQKMIDDARGGNLRIIS